MKGYKRTLGIAVISLVIGTVIASCVKKNVHTVDRSVIKRGEPGYAVYPDVEPGEAKPLPRPYALYPALIPHSVKDMTISRTENSCLDCHLSGEEVKKGHRATPVPPSHAVNPYTGERAEDGVVGTRWNCLQCHVPQTTVKLK